MHKGEQAIIALIRLLELLIMCPPQIRTRMAVSGLDGILFIDKVIPGTEKNLNI